VKERGRGKEVKDGNSILGWVDKQFLARQMDDIGRASSPNSTFNARTCCHVLYSYL